MGEALLDTDMLSEILKGKDSTVLASAQAYLAFHQRFAFSAVTFYEVLRGLLAKKATRQLGKFLKTADTSDIMPISLGVLRRAATLWAEAQQHGYPRDDADLIIAATALEDGRELVTGNLPHFVWIGGLKIIDWRSSQP